MIYIYIILHVIHTNHVDLLFHIVLLIFSKPFKYSHALHLAGLCMNLSEPTHSFVLLKALKYSNSVYFSVAAHTVLLLTCAPAHFCWYVPAHSCWYRHRHLASDNSSMLLVRTYSTSTYMFTISLLLVCAPALCQCLLLSSSAFADVRG